MQTFEVIYSTQQYHTRSDMLYSAVWVLNLTVQKANISSKKTSKSTKLPMHAFEYNTGRNIKISIQFARFVV